jgi:glucosamine-6-phosphate deaminase
VIETFVFPSPDALARRASRLVSARLAASSSLVLGLPTGQTPILLYRALGDAVEDGRLDFSRATTFNLDEFCGVGPGHPGSYHTFMDTHLFGRINLPRRRAHLFNGLAADWREEAARYERAIARAGGLDLVILGIGRNGHLGFNEPGTSLQARSHRVKLTESSRRANAALFGGAWRRVPTYALSMGIGTILSAREVVLLAHGHTKARIVARALRGPVTTQVPASLLQAHPKVTVLLDRAAAAHLG